MMDQGPVAHYLLSHLPDLLYRDVLQELLTIPERCHIEIIDGVEVVTFHAKPYVGKLVVRGDVYVRVESFTRIAGGDAYTVTTSETNIPYTQGAILSPRTSVMLDSGILANYPNGPAIKTCYGRVIVNYLLFAYPFGNVIPYLNKVWKAGEIERLVGDAIIQHKVTVDQVNIYINNMLYVGHSPEFCSPNLTEKSLTTDPKVAIRKKELLAEHAVALAAGDAVVMSQIETELIQMDRDWLKGDESMNYLLKSKQFDIIRKKLYLTHGMVESFGEKGQYAFVPNSLEEGWTQGSFPTIANEIRAGSYARAKETAKGGEESKFLLRVFQNTRVTEQDCGTTRTLDVLVHKDNSSEYVYRNYVDDSGNVQTIEGDAHKSYIGKVIRFRSPMYCTAVKGGYCYTCMGKTYGNLNQDTMATTASGIGNLVTTLSLKASHGVKINTVEITDLNLYLVK